MPEKRSLQAHFVRLQARPRPVLITYHGIYYREDKETGKQQSLRTKDKVTAQRLFKAMNEAQMQPALNLQIARAYLNGADPDAPIRTLTTVMDEIVKTKPTKHSPAGILP